MENSFRAIRMRGILILQIASLAAVALSFWLAVSAYPLLPDTVAVHFDFSGVPDRWETKTWFTVLLFPLIQLGAFLLVTGLNIWAALSPESLAYISLPIDKQKLSSAEQKEKIRLLAAFSGSLINLLIMVFMTYVNYIVLQSEKTARGGPEGPVFFATGAFLACLSGVVAWVSKEARRIARA